VEWLSSGTMDEGSMQCSVLSRFPQNEHEDSFAICIETRVIPPEPCEGHVLVQVFGAGISASDIDLCRGKMPFVVSNGLPFVCGRDFCGLVVKGSIDMLGKVVMGTGVRRSGEWGSSDGTHAQFIVASESQVVEKSNAISVASASCLGVPFTTGEARFLFCRVLFCIDFNTSSPNTQTTQTMYSMGGLTRLRA
jgi:NADPH:quinone reductase-like Zn-dependent oxidoreductase